MEACRASVFFQQLCDLGLHCFDDVMICVSQRGDEKGGDILNRDERYDLGFCIGWFSKSWFVVAIQSFWLRVSKSRFAIHKCGLG